MIEEKNLISEWQASFMKYRNTREQAAHLTQYPLKMAFIDSKARWRSLSTLKQPVITSGEKNFYRNFMATVYRVQITVYKFLKYSQIFALSTAYQSQVQGFNLQM